MAGNADDRAPFAVSDCALCAIVQQRDILSWVNNIISAATSLAGHADGHVEDYIPDFSVEP